MENSINQSLTAKESNLSESKVLFYICFLVYACAYIARKNYSSAVNDMVAVGVVTESIKGLISSVYFITYAVGQLINGILADKKSPFLLVGIGLFLILFAEIAMFTINQLPFLLVFWWGLNGFGQSMLWAPIFYLINNVVHSKYRFKAVTMISLSTPVGNVMAFFLSALSLEIGGWKGTFVMASIVVLILIIMWVSGFFALRKGLYVPLYYERHVKKEKVTKSETPFFKYLTASGIIIFIPALIVHGLFLNGAVEWIPSILQNQYGISSVVSSYLMMIVPAVGAFGVFICNFVYSKLKKNEAKTAIFFFIVSLILTAVLFFMVSIAGKNNVTAVIFVIVFGIIYTAQLAVGHTMISFMPMHFRGVGYAATFSGLMNAINYGGSAISTYAMSFLTDNSTLLLTIWLITLVVAIVFLIIGCKRWTEYSKDTNII